MRALLFDLDGTLVDSAPDIASALNALAREHDLASFPLEEVRSMIGDGARVLIERAFAARGREAPGGALERFIAIYSRGALVATRPYDGIPELLERLARTRRLAVVTNKPQALSEQILGGLGLSSFFAQVVGPERVSARKPSAAHVLDALALLGVAAADATMIGDGPTDVTAGRAAGVATIGVLWGYRPESELVAAGAERLVRTVSDLARIVE